MQYAVYIAPDLCAVFRQPGLATTVQSGTQLVSAHFANEENACIDWVACPPGPITQVGSIGEGRRDEFDVPPALTGTGVMPPLSTGPVRVAVEQKPGAGPHRISILPSPKATTADLDELVAAVGAWKQWNNADWADDLRGIADWLQGRPRECLLVCDGELQQIEQSLLQRLPERLLDSTIVEVEPLIPPPS